MELYTPRLILREFLPSDFEAVREFDTLLETHYFEKMVIPSEEVTRAFLRDCELEAMQVPRQTYHLAVTIRPDGTARGKIKLTVLRSDVGEWEIGWVIHRDDWGKGYATEAARAVLDFAFVTLKAHRVVAFCNAHNAQSYRVMEKLGMQRDGLLRESLWWNNQWSDECVYAILEREWEELSH